MEYLLFVVYLVLFSWLVTRVGFFKNSGLSQSQLIIIFLLKVMAGIFYGWIGIYYGGLAQMSDTWGFHTNSVEEFKLLQTNPTEYLTNLFHNPYGGGFDKLFSGDESYWNDLKGNSFIKVLSIFNIFSFSHYYVNVIFYSFVSLFGPVAIYRVMSDVFPNRKIQLLLAAFFIPSFYYWTSGIHKEGLIFLGVALIIYQVYFGLKQKRFGIKRVLGIALGLLILLLLRNFLIVIIVPAIFTWIIASLKPQRGLLIFAATYCVFIILFFTIRYIKPELDFPQAVVSKQQEFMKLPGNSSVPIAELKPNAISFLKNSPEAFTLSTIRPYPSDVRHILSLAAAVEVSLLLILLIILLLFHRNGVQSKIFIYFCLFFCFSLLLAIGFSVNNLGAIVRYRSIMLPLLVVPMVALIDWKRLNKLFFNGIKNKNNV